MKYKTTLVAIACLLLGIGAGLEASDRATLTGFPYDQYMVELAHSPTPESNFRCMRRGVALGTNLSSFDRESGHQRNCLLLVTGKPRQDGSFDAYMGGTLWRGRLEGAKQPLTLPAAEILSLTKML